MTLSIEGLTICYRVPGGTITALSEVSLSVGKGRTLAVVGKSGSGKSTVALAIMGLLASEAQIAAGRILYEGSNLLALSPEAHRRLRGARIAVVFQDPFSVLNPSLRIAEQVGEGLVYHKGFSKMAAVARATQLLHEVGIAEAAAVGNAYPHELSGGMRQRALIAGALAAEPDFLILDEPTTALDVTIEAQILDLLEELQSRRGLSMLFISHNLGVVRRIADEVAVLYAGEVVESGPTAEVFERPVSSLHKGPIGGDPAPRRGPGALGGHSRPPAGPAPTPRRLPFRTALPVRATALPRAAKASRHGRRTRRALLPRGRTRERHMAADGWAACRSAAPHVGRQTCGGCDRQSHQDLYLEPWPRRSHLRGLETRDSAGPRARYRWCHADDPPR